jgi:hypothetical protein
MKTTRLLVQHKIMKKMATTSKVVLLLHDTFLFYLFRMDKHTKAKSKNKYQHRRPTVNNSFYFQPYFDVKYNLHLREEISGVCFVFHFVVLEIMLMGKNIYFD